MRTSRIRTTALAAAATAALAVSLTACGSSDDNGAGKTEVSTVGKAAEKTDKADKAGTSGGSDDQAAGTSGSAATGGDQAGPSRSASGPAAKGSGTTVEATRSTSVRQCDGTEMSYSVLHRFAKQRGEHLLITATNADSKPCWVTSYPSVMLGNSANVLRHSAKDAPGGTARITVKPGGKVYSAVNLFTGGGSSQTSADLSLALRDQTGDTGPGTDQQAFAKGAPSKFTWSSADVTNWNTAKPYDF
ncbi:DUF4232 domain-containing protein [Streptomyces spectabilis]|uniref:DUF4232 domain-containing protein n=1 Tax=Streptomyces spectabilis TaxID=68270 RepID=A0A516R707_STRST|nr:DUF4232 domain-containing protein [Streptomyces spectabilis]QDQ11439.1 DUF4232 domain-containing protein [Streptomyces spectabilis]